MVEELGELDERHFSIGAGHIHDPAAESLAEGMCADVPCLQLIDGLDPFQVAIDHLAGQDRSVFGQEAGLRRVRASQCPPAVTDMLLEALVDPHLPSLSGLLFVQGERAVLGQYLLPAERPQVGEPQPEEAAAADEEGHPIVPVAVQPTDEVHSLVPFDVVGRCKLVLECHWR